MDLVSAETIQRMWTVTLVIYLVVVIVVAALLTLILRAARFSAPVNYLSKIRMGVRAIEKQTDALGPSVTKLNAGLGAILGGLKAVDGNLAGLIAAVSRQRQS